MLYHNTTPTGGTTGVRGVRCRCISGRKSIAEKFKEPKVTGQAFDISLIACSIFKCH